jgi:hypothetical protein
MPNNPAIQFSDPRFRLVERVGIVNHSTDGQADYIWFSRPSVLIGVTLSAMGLLCAMALTLWLVTNAPDRLAPVFFLCVPLVILSLLIIRLRRNSHYFVMRDGKLLHVQAEDHGSTVLSEVEGRLIYSFSSEAASISPKSTTDIQSLTGALPYILFPSILVCAEPRNLMIEGPRRFRYNEAKFIITVLDRWHHVRP